MNESFEFDERHSQKQLKKDIIFCTFSDQTKIPHYTIHLHQPNTRNTDTRKEKEIVKKKRTSVIKRAGSEIKALSSSGKLVKEKPSMNQSYPQRREDRGNFVSYRRRERAWRERKRKCLRIQFVSLRLLFLGWPQAEADTAICQVQICKSNSIYLSIFNNNIKPHAVFPVEINKINALQSKNLKKCRATRSRLIFLGNFKISIIFLGQFPPVLLVLFFN